MLSVFPLKTVRIAILPAALAALVALVSTPARAQTAAHNIPKISSGVAKTTATGQSPSTFEAAPAATVTPCTVTLFSDYQFNNFNAQYFTYTPSCPGPWARVVFRGDFAITTGIQFDRTAEVAIGNVNVYFGTTREDDPDFGPTWTVTRDVTQYTSLFTAAQSGEVDLGNLVNSTYTGVISGSTYLDFYPVTTASPAPVVADAVYPLAGPGGAVALGDTSAQLAQTFTLPTNVVRAYLDVITQSQSSDEFWWSCAPNQFAAELDDCGNSAFREAEIAIDNIPAGIAPVYPWIYTGGIDPNLWLPIPGVQTLNFVPYQVDLTPFAGTLSNGQAHTVAVSVYNADNYFATTAALRIYEDHGSSTVTGATTVNTLTAAPNPTTGGSVTVDSNGVPVGYVSVGSIRRFTISGYVNSSAGKVTTTIAESDVFSNLQTYSDDANTYKQNTAVNYTTTVYSGGNTQVTNTSYAYPLDVSLSVFAGTNGDEDETVAVQQGYYLSTSISNNGTLTSSTGATSEFNGSDTIDYTLYEDVGQQSSLFSTVANGNKCVQQVTEAVNDTVTSSTTGPCLSE